MKLAPSKCILCHCSGRPEVWNGLEILICPDCSLAWRVSFDLPDDYYDTVEVDNQNSKKKKRERNTFDQIDTLRKFLPPDNIYDLGSGDGTFLTALKERGYKNCVGLEPGENGLRISKQRGLNVFQGKINDLTKVVNGKKIKGATLFHLLEHLSDPRETLKIIRSNLTENGVLVMETPNSTAPIQRITNHKNHLVYPEHLFYWNKKSLIKLLDQSGYQIIVIKYRSFDWQKASISNSLLRLGFKISKNEEKNKNDSNHFEQNNDTNQDNEKRGSVRTIVRTILAHAVHVLRRDDYVIIVATPHKN